MRSVTITTDKATIVVVDLPSYCNKPEKEGYIFREKYKHLGSPDQVKEEQWKDIVDDPMQELFGFYSEMNGEVDFRAMRYKTATESGLSLLKANGVVLDNPLIHPKDDKTSNYSEPLESNGFYQNALNKWQQAQEQVWSNPQIFVKT